MDDIIINLGLLRNSLILFQIKLQFIDGINMEFNSNYNIIIIMKKAIVL